MSSSSLVDGIARYTERLNVWRKGLGGKWGCCGEVWQAEATQRRWSKLERDREEAGFYQEGDSFITVRGDSMIAFDTVRLY